LSIDISDCKNLRYKTFKFKSKENKNDPNTDCISAKNLEEKKNEANKLLL
jgi:hypothetical protein